MKYIARERKEEVKRQSEAAIHRVVDMYGTDDFFRIDEMGQSGELTVWLMGRFGTTNFTIIDRLLKSGKYGDQKDVCRDENQYADLASSPDVKFCPVAMTLKKTVLRGGPCIVPPGDDSPTVPQHPDECDGLSASHRLGRLRKISVNREMNRIQMAHSTFAMGGKQRNAMFKNRVCKIRRR